MPVESAADRAVFFNTDEFGEAARFLPKNGVAVDCTIVNSAADTDARLDTIQLRAQQTIVLARKSEIGETVRGGRFVIDGATFAVENAARLDETREVWTIPLKPVEA